MTDQYATVPLPPPGPERDALMQNAVAIGSLNEYFENLLQTPARDAREQELADQEQQQAFTAAQQEVARACAAQIIADGITRLSTRLDTYIEQLEEQAEREAALEEARKDTARFAEMPPSPNASSSPGGAHPAQDAGELQATKDAPPDPMSRDEPEEQDPDLPRAPVAAGFD